MSQYQPVEENYAEEYPEDYGYQQKRKRLSQNYAPRVYNSAAVDIVAWGAIGTVGLALTIGSIIVADRNHESWVMVIPMIFMITMMRFMRQR